MQSVAEAGRPIAEGKQHGIRFNLLLSEWVRKVSRARVELYLEKISSIERQLGAMRDDLDLATGKLATGGTSSKLTSSDAARLQTCVDTIEAMLPVYKQMISLLEAIEALSDEPARQTRSPARLAL